MPQKAIGMALCALLVLTGCGGDEKTVIDITAPSPTNFTATLTLRATAEAYASCNAGSSKATAYATATAEVTVTGVGTSQAAADEDAQKKAEAALAEKMKAAKATAEAQAVAICETGGTPIPGPPGPTPKAQCDDGLDNDGDGKIDYPADPGCTSKDDNDEWNGTTPGPEAPTCTLTASPSSITSSQSSTLTWSSTNATSVTASGGWSGEKALSGNQSVSPSSTTTYTITCTGPGGTRQATATVSVNTPPAAPICSISANPSSIAQGGTSTLAWTSGGGTVRLDKSWTDNTSLNGSSQVVLESTRTFTVTCFNSAGQSATSSVTVTVTGPACPTTNDYTPAGGAIAVGQSITLTATDARCDPFWGVDKPSLGSIVGSDKVVVIDGKQYPVGTRAVVKRIAPGTFQGFIQPSVVNNTKTWHTWTNPTSLTALERSEPEGRASIMFEVRADGSVWYNGRPVEQTGPPKK